MPSAMKSVKRDMARRIRYLGFLIKVHGMSTCQQMVTISGNQRPINILDRGRENWSKYGCFPFDFRVECEEKTDCPQTC